MNEVSAVSATKCYALFLRKYVDSACLKKVLFSTPKSSIAEQPIQKRFGDICNIIKITKNFLFSKEYWKKCIRFHKNEAEQLFSTFIIIPNVSSAYYTFCVCVQWCHWRTILSSTKNLLVNSSYKNHVFVVWRTFFLL